MAANVVRLARPGSTFLLFAFSAARTDLPRFSLSGPSRMVPVLEPGEEQTLYGRLFEIERLPDPDPRSRTAAFVMTRRDAGDQHDGRGVPDTSQRAPQDDRRR